MFLRTRSRGSQHLPGVFVQIGIVVLAIVVVFAIFAPFIAPHDPYQQDLSRRLVPPFWREGGAPDHLLGTDQLGRDYLSRLIFGARISLIIGLSTVLISGVIGTSLGLLGGFYGSWIDDVVMFIITCRLAIPVILVALALVSLMGSSLELVILSLGLLLWDRFAVVARTNAMQIRNRQYIEAAWSAGASHTHVLIREVLPNIVPSLIVVATLEVALAILLEAVLSFLGLGVPPPLPSWGLMIAEAKDYMFFSSWIIVIPGVALFLLIASISFIGDGLRSKMDLTRQ